MQASRHTCEGVLRGGGRVVHRRDSELVLAQQDNHTFTKVK